MDYIKLSRAILEWEWYTDINTSHLFIYMLLRANWKDGNFKGREVPRGSFISSLNKLSADTGLTINEIRTALTHLTATGEVVIESTNRFSIYTIRNYAYYQDFQGDNTTNSTHSIDKPLTTIEKGNKERTHNARESELYANYQKICEQYPKNDGKTGAFKWYKLWINGLVVGNVKYKLTNKAIWTAVVKYVNQMQDEGKEYRYYKDFKTLMGQTLLDYVDDKEQYAEVDDT